MKAQRWIEVAREDLDVAKKIVRNIVSAVDGRMKIEKVFLFGSYAKGRAKHNSDIDLAFVSKDFQGMKEIRRMSLLLDFIHQVELDEPKDIEPFGITPEELKSPEKFSLVEEIKTHGVELYHSRRKK